MGTKGWDFLESPVVPENYETVVNYLLQQERSLMKPGLEGMRALLDELDRPQDSFHSILVGGTNGKGSTVTFLYNILLQAGVKTGCYRSPQLFSFSERFDLGGKEPSREEMALGLEKLRQAAVRVVERKGPALSPSPFELFTALAFLLFRERDVTWAVVEVGMGGRLDATNVLDPVCSLITNVSLDHQNILGPTLLHIAREKAGILRKGRPLFTTAEGVGLLVLEEEAERLKVPLHRVDGAEAAGYQLGLSGAHQRFNASLALATARWLKEEGFMELDEVAVSRGLEASRLPGRLQEVDIGIPGIEVLMDVAHNPAGAEVVRNHILQNYPNHKLVVLAGFQKDKDFSGFLRKLYPVTTFLLRSTSSDRSWGREDMLAAARALERQGQNVRLLSSVEEFRSHLPADTGKTLLLVTGSHYTVRDFILSIKKGRP